MEITSKSYLSLFFQQIPETVAEYFDREIKKVFCDKKVKIVFAVIPPLPNQTDNLTPFKEKFFNI